MWIERDSWLRACDDEIENPSLKCGGELGQSAMALLKQTPTLASTPGYISSSPSSLFLCSRPCLLFLWKSKKLDSSIKSKLKVECHSHSQYIASHSKPPEIQWKRELTNSVQLIGTVGTPVEIKHLPSGKVLAWTRLAIWKSANETSWISLTFWDELAQTAFQHVEKGQQIYVSGRLVSDVVETDDGKLQTYYKVVVQQLNFIERSLSSISPEDKAFNFPTSGKSYANNVGNSSGSTEELWQAFFANPTEWWDNRSNKRSPKYPDFKHKDTGEALWVEGRYNPPWVKSQLAILDTRVGSLHEQDDRRRVRTMSTDELFPY